MTDTQRDAYEGATEIQSEPFGIVDRDNRNHRKKREIIEASMAADSGDAILEVGCGHGLHAQSYALKYDYTGIDISESLVETTRQRVHESAMVRQGDARNLTFPDDSFRSVVGTAVLHHMPDPEAALHEWLRVTKPGGSVTLCEPNYLFPKELLEARLIEHEKHKRHMAPWRLRAVFDALPADGELTPCIYTPPWPERLVPLYDGIDAVCRRLPVVRWCAQMLLINLKVPE